MKLMLKPKLLQKYSRRTLVGCGIGLGALVLVSGGAVYAKLGGSATVSSSSDINLQKGLMGWWKLDGDAKDATPHANNGTVTGATLTTDRKGQSNKAYSFNGSSYITIPNSSTMSQTGSLSISAWFYATSYDEGGILGKWTGTYGTSSYLLTTFPSSGDKLAFVVANGSNAWASNYAGSAQYPLNRWNHVVVTFDSSTGQVVMYLNNGVYMTGTSTYKSSNNTSTQAAIGSWGGELDAPANYTGKIDNVRLYNRVLGAPEVTALYNQYDSAIKAASGEKGLAGWWKLDGNAKDSSPYADDGTVSGATLAADRKNSASSAYSFNGTNNYIQVPYNSITRPTTAITVSAWIYTTNNASTTEQRIVSTTESGGYALFLTGSSGDQCILQQVCFMVYQSSSIIQKVQANKSLLANNAWTHIIATYDASTGILNLYLNGSLAATNSVGGVPLFYTYANPLCIGAEANSANCSSGSTFYSGSIDDVRVYNRVLSASDAASLYNSYNSQVELGGSGANGSVSLGKGLIGKWGLNGNAKDATPYSDNGTIAGGVTLSADRKGRASSAYSFDGVSGSIIDMGSSSTLNPASVTVAAWVKGVLSDSNVKGLVCRDVNASGGITNPSYCLQSQAGKLYWTVTNGSNTNASLSSNNFGAVSDNTWYFVVGTYDSTQSTSNMKFYINGQFITSSSTVTGSLGSTTGTTRIGVQKSSFASTRTFNGTIDDVRIWNRPLNDNEISALYQEYQ